MDTLKNIYSRFNEESRVIRYYLVWLIIGETLFHAYFISIGNYFWLYADLLFLTVFGLYQLWKRNVLPQFFYSDSWKTKYFVTAYGMVLIEEVLAALINNINEGFSFSLFLYRVTQFWAFNLFAFSGLIVSTFFLFYIRMMGKRELIVLASLFGLYAEHQLPNIIASPIVFFVYAPIVIAVYYVIFKPSVTFLLDGQMVREYNKFIRYSVAILAVYICSIPFVLVLSYLRLHYPDTFPPCEMIQC